MKISVLTSVPFNAAFDKLLSADLSPKVAFKLKKIALLVADEVKIYEEIRTQIINDYGKKDEEGNLMKGENNAILLDMDKQEEFKPKLDEWAALEVSVELPKISLDELGEKVELSAADLMALEGVITE